MRNYYIMIKATMFLFVLGSLCSCVDDNYPVERNKSDGNLFTLKLPEKNIVNINTRSTSNTYGIEDVLAAVIRGDDGNVVFEYVTNIAPPENEADFVNFTLTTLGVKDDEKLYIFCNVGDQSGNDIKGEQALLTSIICKSSKDVMYGVREANASSNQVSLTHSLSNVEVDIAADKTYSIDSLIVCNVPKEGLASGEHYKSKEVEDLKFNPGTTLFFVPRPDNDRSDISTFILTKLTGKGWYRLDFYEGGSNLDDPAKRADLMKIEKNIFYHFEISSVNNDGYSSKEEARQNTGSNIVYDLSVDKNVSVSNGQYTLYANADEIQLYPNKPSGSIVLSALIPPGSVNDIMTYRVKVCSQNEQVKILKLDGIAVSETEKDSIDLIKDGEKITSENSRRTIEFESVKTWNQGDYLEISLGNITKKIPFKILSANSYLFDCANNQEVKIPFIQANMEKVRIKPDDAIICEVLWADQPGVSLNLIPDLTSGWIKITSNNSSFSGNVIIAAKVDGEIKWSWHLWCMDSDKNPIEFKNDMGVYVYRDDCVQSYCNNEWMDRNLGAYKKDYTLGNAATRGLGYQWGRKDPFSLGGDCVLHYFIHGITSKSWDEAYLYAGQQQPDDGKYTVLDVVLNDTGTSYILKYNNFPNTDLQFFQNLSSGYKDEDIYNFSVKHPYSFIYYSVGAGSKPFDKHAWVSKEGGKTVNDPCPIGWRVPVGEDPNGPWYGLSLQNRYVDESNDPDENSGMRWKFGHQIVYYPFTLFRAGLGGLQTTTELAYSSGEYYPEDGNTHFFNKEIFMPWANTLEGLDNIVLTFNAHTSFGVTKIVPAALQHAQNRSKVEAFPLRCVKDKSIK